ncbi:MAG: carboxyl transferase domain-containing protein [Massiliimalia sp.]|jgi:acetyl-CoA carboxylase carboxyltransferase component
MNPESKMNKLAEYVGMTAKETPARTRISTLFDADTFVELDAFAGMSEGTSGVVTGYGYVGENLVYAYAQDITACGGAMTKVHANKIKKVYELAAKTGCPVVAIYDSNGAKVTEANEMMAAYGEILALSNNVSGVVPQIAVVLGTCAGTSALMACGADFVVMSKEAELFLNAPFVTNAKGDNKEAGTANFVAEAGVASIVADDDNAALEEVRKLVSYLPVNNLAPAPLFETAENADAASLIAKAYKDVDNMCAKALIEAVADADTVVEINALYGTGIVTALGLVSGAAVGFVANNETAGEFGANACDKAARFVRTCDAFNIPVVTLVNTKGLKVTACPKLIREGSKLAHAYAEATTAKIAVICGQAIGAAYLALASNKNNDVTLAWPTAAISAMGLEAYVEFTAHDKLKGTTNLEASRKELVEEYIDTTAGAFKAAENGFVDAVIAPEQTRASLIHAIEMLAGKRESRMPKKHSNSVI